MPILDKRKGDDILALVPASKRTKNEVVFSSREKAVVQNVRLIIILQRLLLDYCNDVLYVMLHRVHLEPLRYLHQLCSSKDTKGTYFPSSFIQRVNILLPQASIDRFVRQQQPETCLKIANDTTLLRIM